MFEKIKSQLMASKGTNSVSDRTLEEQAQLLSSLITTDEQLAAYDLVKHVNTLGGNISHDVAEQARLAKEELEKKYSGQKTPEQIKAEEAERKKLEEANKQKGITPEMQAILDQNKTIMETLSKMQGEKITTSRTEDLSTLLKDAPKAYKDQVLVGFGKMNFDNDEDFTSFKETTKTNFDSFAQMAKEQGITFSTPSANVQKPIDNGQDSTLAAAAKMAADSKKTE